MSEPIHEQIDIVHRGSVIDYLHQHAPGESLAGRGGLKIKTLTGDNPEFQFLMRPYLWHGAIEAELDGPVADAPGKVWYMARIAGHMAGFCAATPKDGEILFETDYVLPHHRRHGVYRAMFGARLTDHVGQRIRAWCSDASLPLYLANGFTIVGEGTSERGHHWTEVSARQAAEMTDAK